MPSRIPFSMARIEAIKPPHKGRDTYHDKQTPGLQLRVTENGAKTFSWYRKVNGKPVRMTIGAFPAVTVEQARKRARALTGDVAHGRDPAEERRAKREAPTLADLWQHWIDAHAKLHKKPKSIHEDEKTYAAHLKPWAGRRLGTIRKPEVAALHAKVGREHGHYSANRMLALLRAMLNKAADIGHTGDNPARGVHKFAETKRDRFLQAAELPRFFEALAAEPNETLRDFFLLALLTGARKANLLEMQWQDIDFHTALWRIPDTKSNKPVVVPLIAPALNILNRRRLTANRSPWVFPGHCTGRPLVYPDKAWKQLLARAGIANLRIHDLRRTVGSWQALTGASLPIIGAMPGHTQPSTTAIYARLTADPVREAAARGSTAMLAAGGVLIGANGIEHDKQTEGAADGQA